MLEQNRSLAVLDLSRNYKAMTSGSIVLFRSLTKNESLRHLRLNSIVINECTLVSIRHCLQRNRALQRLDMEEVDGLTRQVAAEIVAEARRCGSHIMEIRATDPAALSE